MKYKQHSEAEWLAVSKETRGNLDQFFWYLATAGAGTLLLLFNFIKDANLASHSLAQAALRFSVWFILASFLLAPFRNLVSNDITRRLNLIGTGDDKDEGRSLVKIAKRISFVRNICGLIAIFLYAAGIVLSAVAVNALYLH